MSIKRITNKNALTSLLNFSSIIIFIIFFQFSSDIRAEIMRTTLDNGLKVILKKDTRSPVVTSQIWYKVGSADEYGGITGVSHALEHMMFKGTKKFPSGRFSKLIASYGGSENAFTSRDYTAYYQTLPTKYLNEAIKLESDRMNNLILQDDDFLKEMEVIKEERRMRTDDRSEAIAYEQLYATAFNNNPYHHPIIGWMEDLETMKLDDLSKWYKNWYAPNNATLVIVGDIDFNETMLLVKKYYGRLPKEEIKERKKRLEPVQIGERTVNLKIDSKPPYIILGYKVPSLNSKNVEDWECYALSVLSGILSEGENSRLLKSLVREKKLAASVDTSYSLFARNHSLFLIDANPNIGKSLNKIDREIIEILELIKKGKIGKKELKRIKAQVIANEVYQQDSIFYQGMLIGMSETTMGNSEIIGRFVDNIKSVTPEQIKYVAKKYLVSEKRTVAIVNQD